MEQKIKIVVADTQVVETKHMMYGEIILKIKDGKIHTIKREVSEKVN